MTKRLRKETMIRSKLRNKFNKSRTCANLQNYRKQRNKCTKVLKNAKQQCLNNLNSKSITDTKNRPSARSITLRGQIFFKKGQLPGRLKQLNLEQDPGHNKRSDKILQNQRFIVLFIHFSNFNSDIFIVYLSFLIYIHTYIYIYIYIYIYQK